MADRVIDVAAGVIVRPDGMLLLGQRPEGKPWSGWWELPGGKVEAGETVREALVRELEEEIGIHVTVSRPWVTYVHAYPEKTVRLSFCKVTAWTGEPVGRESQDLAWVWPHEAEKVGPLLPATLPVLKWLALPERYGISSVGTPAGVKDFFYRLDRALAGGLQLVQWREPGWPDGADSASLYTVFRDALSRCRAAGARLLVNSAHPLAWAQEADGLHLRAQDAARAATEAAAASSQIDPIFDANVRPTVAVSLRDALPGNALLGVSVHQPRDVAAARVLNADFVVAGPVLPTASHPGAPGVGWDGLTAMLADAGLPAFAIGGLHDGLLETAFQAGAHGIAGIRAFI